MKARSTWNGMKMKYCKQLSLYSKNSRYHDNYTISSLGLIQRHLQSIIVGY